MKHHEKVIEGLQYFVKWWNYFVNTKGNDSTYAKWIGPMIEYWEQMIVGLNTPCVHQEDDYLEFWPKSASLTIVAFENAFVDDINFGLDES